METEWCLTVDTYVSMETDHAVWKNWCMHVGFYRNGNWSVLYNDAVIISILRFLWKLVTKLNGLRKRITCSNYQLFKMIF